MIIVLRRGKEVFPPMVINDQIVERVDTFKFLGTTICHTLMWEVNISYIINKAHQRLHFLWQLKKFGVIVEAMLYFYSATVESVLDFSITAWYGNTTALLRRQVERVVCTASKIIGCNLPSLLFIYATHTRCKRRLSSTPVILLAPSSNPYPQKGGFRVLSVGHPASGTAHIMRLFNTWTLTHKHLKWQSKH